MADLALLKTAQGLIGATAADQEAIGKYKMGEVIHGQFARMRNGSFHRKLFALLDLAWDYWEPVGGLISAQERRGIEGLAKYFEKLNRRPGQLTEAVAAYIAQLEADRGERFPAVEKSREAFREWVTVEAGHFHLVQTPGGIRKEAKSIAWASMDEDAFSALYRDVFAVCWRLVLSAHFESEADALAVAEQLGGFA